MEQKAKKTTWRGCKNKQTSEFLLLQLTNWEMEIKSFDVAMHARYSRRGK